MNKKLYPNKALFFFVLIFLVLFTYSPKAFVKIDIKEEVTDAVDDSVFGYGKHVEYTWESDELGGLPKDARLFIYQSDDGGLTVGPQTTTFNTGAGFRNPGIVFVSGTGCKSFQMFFGDLYNNKLSSESNIEEICVKDTSVTARFNDVNFDHTFYNYIESLVDSGTVGGYSNGFFKPTYPVTRGALAKFARRGLGFDVNKSCESFPDVDSSNVFYDDILTLKCEGVIGGYGDGTFRSDNLVTRAEATKFIIKGSRSITGDPEFLSTTAASGFPDVSYSNVFREFISAASESGIVNGYGDGKFGPDDAINRGGISKLIKNTKDKVDGYDGTGSTNPTPIPSPTKTPTPSVTPIPDSEPEDLILSISMNNNSFTKTTINAEPGQKVVINLESTEGKHQFDLDELNIHSDRLDAGQKDVIEFTIPETSAGETYKYYCGFSNHESLGMVGNLIISN